jgi:hypothetical protein
MSATPTLYRIARGAAAERLDVEPVFSQQGDAPLAPGYGHVVALSDAAGSHLIAAPAAGGAAQAFALQDGAPWLTPATGDVQLGGPWDALAPFALGGVSYLLGYTATNGELACIPLDAQLRAGTPYTYSRRRAPGVTLGFDTVAPIVVNGLVHVLGYGAKTGDVAIYSLGATAAAAAGSPPGTPALLAAPVWDHRWAPDWTRFAFFTLGGETFFLKTNTGRLNVNIDHVIDDPARGTVEVGTYLQLDRALEIDIVRAFCLAGGDPYFLTYTSDGATVFYRFHGDCQGWTEQASLQTVAGATQIVACGVGESTYVLFY